MEEIRKQQLEQIFDQMSQRKSIEDRFEESFQQVENGQTIPFAEAMKDLKERYGRNK